MRIRPRKETEVQYISNVVYQEINTHTAESAGYCFWPRVTQQLANFKLPEYELSICRHESRDTSAQRKVLFDKVMDNKNNHVTGLSCCILW